MTRSPEKPRRSDWRLIPNQLTLSRFAAAAAIPLVFVFLESPSSDIVALVLFAYASLTDFLDGWLARALNQTSKLGARLDPLADKALLLATLAPLCLIAFEADALFWTGAAVIAVREIGVSLLRQWRPNAAALTVRRDAKWKTAAQMTAVSALLAVGVLEHYFGAAPAEAVRTFGLVVFAIAVVLSATTGLAYLRGALSAPRD